VSRSILPVLLVGLGLASAACHHRIPPAASSVAPAPAPAPAPTVPTTPPPPRPAAAPAPVARAAAPLGEDELFRQKSLEQLNAERPLADVFFDYDQNVLRDDARAALQRDASWLSRWPQTRVMVEGHCDERGTPEYNLALGDRRAETVKDYLASLGIPASRIEIRSLGKESPFCRDEGESCWSQNRRGHFMITAK
jgi:peptidoglycan-associated lipoprotein